MRVSLSPVSSKADRPAKPAFRHSWKKCASRHEETLFHLIHTDAGCKTSLCFSTTVAKIDSGLLQYAHHRQQVAGNIDVTCWMWQRQTTKPPPPFNSIEIIKWVEVVKFFYFNISQMKVSVWVVFLWTPPAPIGISNLPLQERQITKLWTDGEHGGRYDHVGRMNTDFFCLLTMLFMFLYTAKIVRRTRRQNFSSNLKTKHRVCRGGKLSFVTLIFRANEDYCRPCILPSC